MQKLRWKSACKIEVEKIKKIAEQIPLPFALVKILMQRGLDEVKKINDFLTPDLKNLHDPFLMKDMQKAVDRLEKALINKEKILIYGDYDVDGTTAVALMYQVILTLFKQQNRSLNDLDFYIPDRYTEGYGISFISIDYAEKNGFSLIIALDCGIKAIDKISYAKAKNIDFIICDHHLPEAKIPDAVAVLDPKQQDCAYPYKELSGCGVGFKFLQAFFIQKKLDLNLIFSFLDLVMVSVACDLVPITDENRILAFFGLQLFNNNPSLGLKKIKTLDQTSLDYTISDVVFKVGPRINAAGRMASGKDAVRLLVSAEENLALELAEFINHNNQLRKEVEENITQAALAQLEHTNENRFTNVVFHKDWHKGVIGIVASRLIETHYKPTIVLTASQGKICGSARSVENYNLYAALDACAESLEQYGGHQYAAGLTLKPENLTFFKEKFEEVVKNSVQEEHLFPQVQVDVVLPLQDLCDAKALSNNEFPAFFKALQHLAPFGPGHRNPVFYSKNIWVKNVKLLQNKHLNLELTDLYHPAFCFVAIGFNLGTKLSLAQSGQPLEIIYTLEANIWKDHRRTQLMLKDLKLQVL